MGGVLGDEVRIEGTGSVWWHVSTIPAPGPLRIGQQATPHVRLPTYDGYVPGRMWGTVGGTTVGV